VSARGTTGNRLSARIAGASVSGAIERGDDAFRQAARNAFFEDVAVLYVNLNPAATCSAADSGNPQRASPLLFTADLVLGKTVKYRRRRATVRQMQRSPATVERLATGRPREDSDVICSAMG
jgi:hypothetical protein